MSKFHAYLREVEEGFVLQDGNSRNGTTPKTLASEVGDIALDGPRDRAGTFEPRLLDALAGLAGSPDLLSGRTKIEQEAGRRG